MKADPDSLDDFIDETDVSMRYPISRVERIINNLHEGLPVLPRKDKNKFANYFNEFENEGGQLITDHLLSPDIQMNPR